MEMTPIEVRDEDEDDGYQTHMSEFSDATEVEDHITEILEEEEPKNCDENHCEGHKVEVITPDFGMKFEDPEQMYELFKTYGKKLGFSVRRRHSRKGDDGVTRYLALGCSRGTKIKDNNQVTNPLKRRPQWGTDCKVRLTACLQNDGSWVITKVFLDHNHDLSPNKVRYYRCHRKLPPHMQRRLLINDVGGVRGNKNINSVVVESGGYEQMGCIEKDCRNFLDKQRRLRLGEGDGIAILNYFLKMQATNTGFVFCMDLDHEDRLRNVFWADGRCREAYKEFGDVITFDSTYLTNKYDMPFSPFVGVNHHGQSILLGCALLSNEDIPTFVWLFNTWLKCMNGVHPKGIITDQDKAMQAAIASVFPDTRHRWCLWHIMKKLKDKIGNRKDKDVIRATVKNVVYDTQTTVEFEKLWAQMIDDYELQGNTWLSGLYEERGRWVPCFVKTTFWAGMSTTQRSESMNAFFDGYVNSKTTLKQFVEQYENALRNKAEKEFYAEFQSFSQVIPCTTLFGMEQQAQQVYTVPKFIEFVVELTGKMYCEIIDTREDAMVVEYDVQAITLIGDFMRALRTFTVSYHIEEDYVSCTCLMFEFKGMLCRHAIHVLISKLKVDLLPERYILKRWRKDVKRPYMRCKINYNGWISNPEQKKYDEFHQIFANVVDMGMLDDERYNRYKAWGENELKQSGKRSSCGSSQVSQSSKEQSRTHRIIDSAENATQTIHDPKRPKKKGRPRIYPYQPGHQSKSSGKSQVNTSGDHSQHEVETQVKKRNQAAKKRAAKVKEVETTTVSCPQQIVPNPWTPQQDAWSAWRGYAHTQFFPPPMMHGMPRPPPMMHGMPRPPPMMYGMLRPPVQHQEQKDTDLSSL